MTQAAEQKTKSEHVAREDHMVEEIVHQQLQENPRTSKMPLYIKVENGIVTLAGTVNNYPAKVTAREIAYHVPGVVDVLDTIEVRRSNGRFVFDQFPADCEITRAVQEVLKWDVLVTSQDIRCVVANGWVTLTGAVPSQSDRQEAERAVGYVRGVRGIVNHLRVVPETREH
ncbi:MAG TPA: BON domain-containing protein [Chthonomonadaceae bacterium]|nr:BON domain-containing protein [Chthonomonadaceae bacterium]